MGTEATVATAAENILMGLKERAAVKPAEVTAGAASGEVEAKGAEGGGGAAEGGAAGGTPEVTVEGLQAELAAAKKLVADYELKAAEAAKAGEVERLQKEVAALKAGENVTAERRKAEDVTAEFIRSDVATPFPSDLLRKLLPVSADRKVLIKELRRIGDWVEAVIAHDVKRGRLQRVGIGSGNIGPMARDGGTTPANFVPANDSAFSNIQNGLRSNRSN